ncbi:MULTISPECIES: hypothetical protein [Mycobacteriaceae]|uniref:hypothetical protein n=1 Tax=Mycobacteriaceae TaxID=1762 RepID=UPI0010423F33|nr:MULTISPECIES: hypothetical protein [Mycobacteriaceae]
MSETTTEINGTCCMVWCNRLGTHDAHEPESPEEIITRIVYSDTDWPRWFDQQSAINASRLTAQRILADLERRGFDVVGVPAGWRVSIRPDRDAQIALLNAAEADACSCPGGHK